MALRSCRAKLRTTTPSNVARSAFVARTCPSPRCRSLRSGMSALKLVVPGRSPTTGANPNPFDIRLRDPEVPPARNAIRPHRSKALHCTLRGRRDSQCPDYCYVRLRSRQSGSAFSSAPQQSCCCKLAPSLPLSLHLRRTSSQRPDRHRPRMRHQLRPPLRRCPHRLPPRPLPTISVTAERPKRPAVAPTGKPAQAPSRGPLLDDQHRHRRPRQRRQRRNRPTRPALRMSEAGRRWCRS
jgi:hypothetical protein